MKYELAKRLKDAGFPFRKSDVLYCDNGCCGNCNDKLIRFGSDTYWVPTLEELLDACKGHIVKLWVLKDGHAGVQRERESLHEVVDYLSASEAVAEFWLKLKV